jgi:hypothetical protein
MSLLSRRILKMIGLLEGTPNTVETKQLDELSIQIKEKK